MTLLSSPVVRAGNILIVDDEVKILKLLSRSFSREGHDVTVTTDPSQALRLLRSGSFDVLILDNRMPELSGLELLKQVRGGDAAPEVILMTAYGTVESAVEAMKLGALDYIQKPFEFDSMKELVRSALVRRREKVPSGGGQIPPAEESGADGRYGLVGRSPALQEVLARMEIVAPADSTILITGETGTGKELVARAIHRLSPRGSMPLVKVNCAAIPDGLLESEMFGYVRGAFTGATHPRRGKFALAHQGSLFLDEVSGLGPALQQKLLRALEEKEFEPLGSERTQRADVRVLAATNRNLAALTAQGHFQEDLYYRLKVIPIHLPSLRERREDIPLLAETFLASFRHKLRKGIEGFAPGVIEKLTAREWPGNVRELENAIQRAVALTPARLIRLEDLSDPGEAAQPGSTLPSLDLRRNLTWMTRETILQSLEKVKGRKKEAAALLGISQRALSYYLRKYEI